MKKVLFLFIAGLFLCGCQAASSDVSVICSKGDSDLQELSLLKVEEGAQVLLEKAVPDEAGNFTFIFTPEKEGFYTLRGDKSVVPRNVYIKPGDRLTLTIDYKKIHLAGKENSQENQLLEAWIDLSAEIESKSFWHIQLRTPYQEYFVQLEDFYAASDKFIAELSGDQVFKRLMTNYVLYSRSLYALSYIFSPMSADAMPARENYPPLYSAIIRPDIFADTTILEMPFGITFIQRYLTYAMYMSKSTKMDIDTVLPYVQDPTVKGVVIAFMSRAFRTYFEAQQAHEKYSGMMTESQRKNFEQHLAQLKEAQSQNPPINFSYPDASGKMFSPADFKGKVVLVDFWATWCGPCKAEIPHLKKLKEEFKGQDVVFVGISVDKKTAYNTWKKFIVDNQLPEPQLFSENGQGDVVKTYGINSIPRFILLDRNGNVVEKNAPAPSSPALKQLIEAELKK